MTNASATIAELCEVQSGGTPSRSQKSYWHGSIPWVKISEMKEGCIRSTEEQISEAGLANSSAKIFPKGTILLSIFATIGRTAFLDIAAATNQAIAGLIIRDAERLDSNYFRRYLDFIAPSLASQGRGAAQANINLSILKRTEVPLPPLTEQRRIAAILDKADALRAKRREAIAKLDQLQQSVFLQATSDATYEALSVGELLERKILLLHKDGNHGSQYPRKEEFGDTGVPFLSAKNVLGDGGIDLSEIQLLATTKAHQLKIGWIEAGDVLLAHNASVGKVALYRGEFEKALIGTSLTAYRPDRDFLRPEFLFMALRSNEFQSELTKDMSQTTRNQVPITAQRRLTIKVPPVAVQDRVVQAVATVKQQKEKYMSHEKSLNTLFLSLQESAFVENI